MSKELKICSICQQRFYGYGNNAEPINDGRCCDDCNATRVIPARMAVLFPKQETKQ